MMLMRNIRPRNVNQLSLTPYNDIFDDIFHFENNFPSMDIFEIEPQKKMRMNMDLDVKHTNESIEISADLPGVSKDDIKIDFDSQKNILTISGERTYEKKYSSPIDENSDGNKPPSSSSSSKSSKSSKSKSDENDNTKVMNEKFIRTERSYGKTSRSIRLPQGIDVNAIRASMDNGVLNISIPKPEEKESTRRITLE